MTILVLLQGKDDPELAEAIKKLGDLKTMLAEAGKPVETNPFIASRCAFTAPVVTHRQTLHHATPLPSPLR